MSDRESFVEQLRQKLHDNVGSTSLAERPDEENSSLATLKSVSFIDAREQTI